MSEDGQFCSHRGIDSAEFSGVIDDALAGEATRGASTITMQTVKNLYLWHRPLGTVRKVRRNAAGRLFRRVLSKRRIMEIYLNIAEWGPNIYGIEAAAQHHFGGSAKSLTRAAGGAAGRDPAQPDRPQSGASPAAWRCRRLACASSERRAGQGRRLTSAACNSAGCSPKGQKNSRRRWPKRQGERV